MVLISQEKLLTLALLLKTMPREQQSLLLGHFSPEVVKQLSKIEQEMGPEVEKMDWAPFYKAWPELQQILDDCKDEIKLQRLIKMADEQRPKIRDYILLKLGRQKKGGPIFLSQEIIKIIDRFVSNYSVN